MIESLSDIEELSANCRSEQSKAYISEAMKCYRGGAYRATVVSAWIAVVFDLIDKIRELSLSGDAAAAELEEKHKNYIKQIDQGNSQGKKSAMEFERNILETCREKLQFFDAQQFLDLQRLSEDRNRCAHPSFQRVGVPYDPSAEQARLHIRNAVVHVLSQPPLQGKAALDELVETVRSAYFPKEKDRAKKQLESLHLNKAKGALVRGFVDSLIFGFFNKDNSLFNNERVGSSLNAVYEMHPGEVEERIRKN